MTTSARTNVLFGLILCACGPGDGPRALSSTGGVRIATASGQVAGMERTATYVSAMFTDLTESPTQCTARTVAGCTVTTCGPATRDSGAGSARPPTRSAGRITMSGAGHTLDFAPNADGTYVPGGSGTMELFPAGTALAVSAAGDPAGIAAWTATVTMPARVTLTAPIVTVGTRLTIVRTQPFFLTWTGGSAGRMTVQFATAAGGSSVGAQCGFNVTAGRGTVSADVLSALAPGGGTILLGVEDSRELTVGAYSVTLSAASTGISDAIVQATFE